MDNSIEKRFCLEQVLEIIDFENYDSLEKIQKKFSQERLMIDYLQLEALRKRIGDIGECYVFECEKTRLKKANSKYADYVDKSPAEDSRNGYDILSYTKEGIPIYIEVKSTLGNLYAPFYITNNEKETAERIRKNGGIYQIHRVYNIGSDIGCVVYNDENEFMYEEAMQRVIIKKNE